MATQVQTRRGTTVQTSTFTGAAGEITVDTTKNTVVAHDGTTAGGHPLAKESSLSANNQLITAAFNTANAAFLAANNATDTYVRNHANSAFDQANAAYAQANTNAGNITVIQSVNLTQNTNITNAQNTADAAFLAANNATDTYVRAHANAAFHQANAAYNQANTNAGAITVIQGVNVTQNTSISNIEAVNLTQNTNITNAQNSASAAFIRANNSLNANVGGTIGGDVSITGNLTVLGNTFSVSSSQIVANDTLFILGVGNYTGDVLDIGFSSHYNAGVNAHTGLIRDSGTKEWQLFEGYTPEIGANNNININDPSFKIATLNANLHSTSIELNGQDLQTYINGAYNTANGAFNSANVINGVNLTQNTNITNAQNLASAAFNQANAAYGQANTNATNITTLQAVNLTQNTSITNLEAVNVTQNTNITVLQGVNTSQNNEITYAENHANSAFNQANAAYTRANNSISANVGGTITGNTTIVGNLFVTNTTTSVSNTTGALRISGGLGVTGNIYADNIYDGGVEIIVFANNAYNQANAAFAAANSPSVINGLFFTG